MQSQRINITLPQSVLRQLDIAIPQGKRSHFIAQVVTEKLGKTISAKKEFARSLDLNKEFYKKIAKEWEETELETWPE